MNKFYGSSVIFADDFYIKFTRRMAESTVKCFKAYLRIIDIM